MHGIYLSVKNDTDGFQLPINPERVSVSSEGDGEEYTVSKLGNVNIPKSVRLTEFDLESFFPFTESVYQSVSFKEPQFYIDRIRKWQQEKESVRYIYVNGSFTINELTTIESFDYEESDGSGDVYFRLELKKYVPFSPQKMKVVKVAAKKKVVKKKVPPRQNKKPQPKTYSLVRGDNLWKLARKYLGDGARYPEIQKLNGIKSSDLRRLQIGMKVKIPPK